MKLRRSTSYLLLTLLSLLIAALLRVWVAREHPPLSAVFSDMGGYVQNAQAILDGRITSQTFFQPIGYPAFLALLRKIGWGLQSMGPINVCASILTVYLAGRIAEHIDGKRTALLTTFVLAVHWSLAYMVGYFMGETLYTLLITLSAWVIVTTRLRSAWSSALVGAILGVSYWLKGYAGPMLILMLVYFGMRFLEQRWWRWRWTKSAVLICAVFFTQPLLHRQLSERLTGTPQWGASTSGLNLVEGKCPWKRNEDSVGYGWWSPLYVQQQNGTFRKWDRPFTDAQYYQQQGIACIKDNPTVMLTSFRHIGELFVRNMLWPASGDPRFRPVHRDYEKAFLGFLFPGLLVGLIALSRSSRARKNLFGLVVMVPILTICGVVYIGKSEIRYRLPFDPFFVLIASAGWVRILPVLPRLYRALFARRVAQPREPSAAADVQTIAP